MAAKDETAQDAGPAENAVVTAEVGDGEGAHAGGRRNRGRRGRGQSGEDRAAEDAAVLDGVPFTRGTAGADEVADYRSEDSSEDLPPARPDAGRERCRSGRPVPESSPDGPPVEPAVVETGPADAPGEIKATGRPRRRRAASRPAGPPV